MQLPNPSRAERFLEARTVYNKNGKQSTGDVEKETGIRKSLISSLENEADRSVGYDKIVILANHYGVSTDWLFGLTNDPHREPCAADDLGLSAHAIDLIIRWKKQGDSGNSILSPMMKQAIIGLSNFVEIPLFLALMSRVQNLCSTVTNENEILQSESELPDDTTISAEIHEIIDKQRPEYSGRYSVYTGIGYIESEINAIVSEFDRLVREIAKYDEYHDNYFGNRPTLYIK